MVLNDKNLKALVLGGTDDHIALIENLKARGYYTVLLDYYDNPPAGSAADIHIRLSTLEQEKVLNVAQGFNVDLVISACIDQALLTACYVAEKLSLPAPFNYETALNVTNKGFMKKKMVESNIPTSNYCLIEKEFDFKGSGLKFPVMVKPADSNGSYGVKKADNIMEANEFLHAALGISRTKKAIIEEFNEGIEVSLDCIIQDFKACILMESQLIKCPVDKNTLLIYQSIGPVDISLKARKTILEITNEIANVFQLDNTPLLIQVIVNDDDVKVVEFSPRIGGGSKHKSIKRITGFDILNSTIDSFLGYRIHVMFEFPQKYYSRTHIYAYPGIFDDIVNYRMLIESNAIEEIAFAKTKGMEIGSDLASRNRVGSFFVTANNRDELMRKTKFAVEQLEVLDINGNCIMRKDIFNSNYAGGL